MPDPGPNMSNPLRDKVPNPVPQPAPVPDSVPPATTGGTGLFDPNNPLLMANSGRDRLIASLHDTFVAGPDYTQQQIDADLAIVSTPVSMYGPVAQGSPEALVRQRYLDAESRLQGAYYSAADQAQDLINVDQGDRVDPMENATNVASRRRLAQAGIQNNYDLVWAAIHDVDTTSREYAHADGDGLLPPSTFNPPVGRDFTAPPHPFVSGSNPLNSYDNAFNGTLHDHYVQPAINVYQRSMAGNYVGAVKAAGTLAGNAFSDAVDIVLGVDLPGVDALYVAGEIRAGETVGDMAVALRTAGYTDDADRLLARAAIAKVTRDSEFDDAIARLTHSAPDHKPLGVEGGADDAPGLVTVGGRKPPAADADDNAFAHARTGDNAAGRAGEEPPGQELLPPRPAPPPRKPRSGSPRRSGGTGSGGSGTRGGGSGDSGAGRSGGGQSGGGKPDPNKAPAAKPTILADQEPYARSVERQLQIDEFDGPNWNVATGLRDELVDMRREWLESVGIDPGLGGEKLRNALRDLADNDKLRAIRPSIDLEIQYFNALRNMGNFAKRLVNRMSEEFAMADARDYIISKGGVVLTGWGPGPGTKGTFDVVGIIDGRLVTIEAKGGTSALKPKWVPGTTPGTEVRVMQGTRQYFMDTLRNDPDLAARLAQLRDEDPALAAQIDTAIARALEDPAKNADFLLVNGDPRTGLTTVKRFDITHDAPIPEGGTRPVEPPAGKNPTPRRATGIAQTIPFAAGTGWLTQLMNPPQQNGSPRWTDSLRGTAAMASNATAWLTLDQRPIPTLHRPLFGANRTRTDRSLRINIARPHSEPAPANELALYRSYLAHLH